VPQQPAGSGEILVSDTYQSMAVICRLTSQSIYLIEAQSGIFTYAAEAPEPGTRTLSCYAEARFPGRGESERLNSQPGVPSVFNEGALGLAP